jgi:poly-gamma-glutamate synthesis protein (capsule biosynthesis protein)
LAWRLISSKGDVFTASGSAMRVLVGGDVEFDPEVRMLWNLGSYRLRKKYVKRTLLQRIRFRLWLAFCQRFFSKKFFDLQVYSSFDEFSIKKPKNENEIWLSASEKRARSLDIDWPSISSDYTYPFKKIASFLKSKDLAFVNLETPLTSGRRPNGLFMSDPHYVEAMKTAGISIVSLANNHIFDAGESGFLDTICHLKAAGISYTGAGDNFNDARQGKLIEYHGTKLIFLGYTQFCNARFASIADKYPGVLPLDRRIIVEDIKAAKKKADFVFISLHWGIENQPSVHPAQIEIAHLLIDEGADCIIGHHPHVPHGIEVYKERPIFYSLGNFIFAQTEDCWSDNILAEIVIDCRKFKGVIIYPISGQGQELFQPEILTGTRADSLLHEIQIKSVFFNTRITTQNHVGYISIS